MQHGIYPIAVLSKFKRGIIRMFLVLLATKHLPLLLNQSAESHFWLCYNLYPIRKCMFNSNSPSSSE